MKGNKRGVVEVQFNWIFIVIVGVIILSFFLSVAGWYKDKSDIDIAYEALGKIETIATGAQVSSDTNSMIEIPKIDFHFECDPECGDDGCYSAIDFEDTKLENQPWVQVESLFAPKLINDDFLIAWSLSWKIPYRVSDFLYLTSPNIQYYLVGSSDFAKDVENKLLENKFLTITRSDTFDGTKVEKGKRIKFIYFDDPTSDQGAIHQSVNEDLRRIVGITEIRGDENTGVAKFYSFVSNGGSNPTYSLTEEGSYGYLMMPSIIGAIFSDDVGFYTCNMNKAKLRAKTVSKVYEAKSTLLANHEDFRGTPCEGMYNSGASAANTLGQMHNQATFKTDTSGYYTSRNDLKSKNEALLLKDCPRIY